MTHRMKIASLLSLGLVSLPACGGPSSDPFDSNSSSADDDEDKNDSDEKDDDGDKGETGEEPTDDDDSNGDSTTGGETNTTTSPGTTGPDPDTGEEVVPGGGYIQSGAWKGYAFTAVEGGTITPEDFAASTDFPLCVSGMLEPGYSNTAMIGWNINQTAEGDPMTVVPTEEGIQVSVMNPGGSELRLQIQGPNGATDENDRWCATIPGNGGLIPFDAFNTQCWTGGMGNAYMGEPLTSVLVLVPGQAGPNDDPPGDEPVPFDFCVTDIVAGMGDGGPVSTGCTLDGPGEGTFTVSGDDTARVTRGGREYIVQNNVWAGDKSAQTLSVNGVSFEVTTQNNNQPTDGAPASFPSTFIGENFGRPATANDNLPIQVSAIQSVETAWRWSGTATNFNAAYDVWFSTNPAGDPGSPSGGYLMVWFHRQNVQPLGRNSGTVPIDGKSWEVWLCGSDTGCSQDSVTVISYVPVNESISEWSYDLNVFIQHAATNYPTYVNSNWYLSNVFAGFEIWSGGVGLQTEDFCAVVN